MATRDRNQYRNTGLRYTLNKKHPTGLCSQCTQLESEHHVLMERSESREERLQVIKTLDKARFEFKEFTEEHVSEGAGSFD